MNGETDDSQPTIKRSLRNFRRNSLIIALLLVLGIALLAIKAPHYEMVWSVILVLIVKAESRPQPIPVVLLAMATTMTSLVVLSNYRGFGHPCEVLTIGLLDPVGSIEVPFQGENSIADVTSPFHAI